MEQAKMQDNKLFEVKWDLMAANQIETDCGVPTCTYRPDIWQRNVCSVVFNIHFMDNYEVTWNKLTFHIIRHPTENNFINKNVVRVRSE